MNPGSAVRGLESSGDPSGTDQRPANMEEILERLNEPVLLRISDFQRQGHHADLSDPDAPLQHVQKEQLAAARVRRVASAWLRIGALCM